MTGDWRGGVYAVGGPVAAGGAGTAATMNEPLFGDGYRSRWLNFRAWLALKVKRNGERLSWWVQP